MSQHLSDQNLIAYVTRTLTDVQRAEIDRHVTECERCRTQLEHHAALQRRIRNSVIAQRKSGPSRHATFAQIAPQARQSRARVLV